MRAALYGRVSTTDQTAENQLLELRAYVQARGWSATEYVDTGVSGAKDRRPALDAMLRDARRRKFDTLIVWRLDRLGRSLAHLVNLLNELQALGIGFTSLGEQIDTGTPAGRLQWALLAAFAQFERERISERIRAGLLRVKANGTKLGRRPLAIADERFEKVGGLSIRDAANQLGVSRSVVHRWRLSRKPSKSGDTFASECAE